MSKPKKWSTLKGTLPEPPPESSEWLRQVLVAKDAYATFSLTELTVAYNDLAVQEEQAKVEERERNVLYAALELRLHEEFEAQHLELARLNGYTWSTGHALRASVEDKAALKRWVSETGQDDLLSVMPGTVTSLASAAMETREAASLSPAERAALKPGDPGSGAPPPGVKVFLQPVINRRKA